MGTRPRTPMLVLGIVVLTGAAVVGIRQWQHHAHVMVIGDSMAALAAQDLRAAGRAAGYDVSIDAHVGVPLAAKRDALKAVAKSNAARVVIELGTNDVQLGTTTATLDAEVDQAVTVMQTVPC